MVTGEIGKEPCIKPHSSDSSTVSLFISYTQLLLIPLEAEVKEKPRRQEYKLIKIEKKHLLAVNGAFLHETQLLS